LKAGIAPPPLITWCWAISKLGCSWSRFGPTLPCVPASLSVWAAAVGGEDVLAVGRVLRRDGLARDHRDVGGDRVGVRALDEVLRHRRHGELDLVADDLLDRHLLEALLAGVGERVVEVRALVPVRAGVGQRVAAGALVEEELLALIRVAGLRDATCAAAGREQRGGQDEERADAPH